MNAFSRHATSAGDAMLAHTIARTAVSVAAGRPSEGDARRIQGPIVANSPNNHASGRTDAHRGHVLSGVSGVDALHWPGARGENVNPDAYRFRYHR
jgi:hypothetical protein